jgi:hypothetical protein
VRFIISASSGVRRRKAPFGSISRRVRQIGEEVEDLLGRPLDSYLAASTNHGGHYLTCRFSGVR